MRKFSALLICLMLFSSLLAACGGGKAAPEVTNKEGGTANSGGSAATQTEDPKEDIADQKITIKIHYPLPDDTTLRQQEDDKIARFQAKYPNVTIVRTTGSTASTKWGEDGFERSADIL